MTRIPPHVFLQAVHDALAGPSEKVRIYMAWYHVVPSSRSGTTPESCRQDKWIDPLTPEVIFVGPPPLA